MSFRLRSRLAAAAVAAILFAPALGSAQTIDQQQTYDGGAFGHLDNWNAQTFMPAASTVTGGGFLVEGLNTTATGAATIGLWSGNPGVGGSVLLASQAVSFTALSYSPTWVDAFWSAVTVTPGATYWLAIGNGPYEGGTIDAPPSSYAGGDAYYNWSSDVATPYSSMGNSFDLAFRTWTDGATSGVTTAPEPASLLLVGTGLGAVAGIARRRRRA